MEQQVQIDPSKLSPADKQDLQQILSNEQQKIQVHQSNYYIYPSSCASSLRIH